MHTSIGRLYVLFGDMSVLVLCPLLNWIGSFFGVTLASVGLGPLTLQGVPAQFSTATRGQGDQPGSRLHPPAGLEVASLCPSCHDFGSARSDGPPGRLSP